MICVERRRRILYVSMSIVSINLKSALICRQLGWLILLFRHGERLRNVYRWRLMLRRLIKIHRLATDSVRSQRRTTSLLYLLLILVLER